MRNIVRGEQLGEPFANWLKNLKQLDDNKHHNQGLTDAIFVIHQLRSKKVTHDVTSARKFASELMFYYSKFVLFADQDAIDKNYFAACDIKKTLGAVFDTIDIGELSPQQIMEQFHSSENTQSVSAKALLYLTALSNIHHYPGEKIGHMPPEVVAPLVFGCLGQRYAFTKRQTINKKALQSLTSEYTDMAFPGYDFTALSRSWMYCSYLYWDQKHDLKKNLNKLFIKWMSEKRLISKKTRPLVKKRKPTILIFAESFSDHHAMFRCHGQSAVSLRENFRTILVSNLDGISPANQKLFSKTVQLDRGKKCVEKNISIIKSFYPDLIYYPSVGMSRNTCYLANLRLAPIQFLAMGHPASTFSKEMDYVVMNNDLRPDPKCFSEKIIHRRISAGYNPYPVWSYAKATSGQLTPTKKKRVGVLGFVPKITQQFLQVCRALDENVPEGVEFHFFPNLNTIDLPAFKALIQKEVATSVIHPPLPYLEYMGRVKQLDLVLSTFPFGNTNGTIDTLLAKKPMVALDGPEPHARTDSRLLRKAGAPEDFLTSSPKQYLNRAVEMLRDEGRLSSHTKALEALNVEKIFFSETDNDFAEIVTLLYNNHESLQRDDRREFDYDDLIALQDGSVE